MMITKCEICNIELESIPKDYPRHEEYWICRNCDATYVYEEDLHSKTKSYTTLIFS